MSLAPDYSRAVVPFELKDVDEKTGTFTGMASVYEVRDLHGETIAPGMFAEDIAVRGGSRKLLWQHDMRELIGGVVVKEQTDGLRVESGQINLDVQKGKEAHALANQLVDGKRVLDSMSIGFNITSRDGRDASRLTKGELWEVSLVTFPANPAALVDSVKAQMAALGLNVDELLELKAGRVLSAKHLKLVTDCRDALETLIQAASNDDAGGAKGSRPGEPEATGLKAFGELADWLRSN